MGRVIKRYFFIGVVCILLIFFGGFFYYQNAEKHRHEFKVTFLNIGQGDSSLIQFADGSTMLVDCGPDKKVLSELNKALPFYVHTINYVLVTHEHIDHYGGCPDVLKRYDVQHLIVNGKSGTDSYYKEWEKIMGQEGADTTTIEAPQNLVIASSTIIFLAPSNTIKLEKDGNNPNNHSIVFKLIANTGITFLFTGDMEVPLEQAIIEKYCTSSTLTLLANNSPLGRGGELARDGVGSMTLSNPPLPRPSGECPILKSDILKVGHHGSNTSSGEDFLKLVKPQIAVISVGKNNKFGHPSLRTLKHLERAGAQVLRTDEMGDIIE